jgi:hypothetical protein
MKNTSLEGKDNELILVLQGHFKGELNLARVKLICLFITALCKIKTINYDRLASGFGTTANKNRFYRRIQRFMKEFDFPMKIVFSLIFNTLQIKHDLFLIRLFAIYKNLLIFCTNKTEHCCSVLFSIHDSESSRRLIIPYDYHHSKH